MRDRRRRRARSSPRAGVAHRADRVLGLWGGRGSSEQQQMSGAARGHLACDFQADAGGPPVIEIGRAWAQRVRRGRVHDRDLADVLRLRHEAERVANGGRAGRRAAAGRQIAAADRLEKIARTAR